MHVQNCGLGAYKSNRRYLQECFHLLFTHGFTFHQVRFQLPKFYSTLCVQGED